MATYRPRHSAQVAAQHEPLPPSSAFFACSPHALDDPRRVLLHDEQPGCLNHLCAPLQRLHRTLVSCLKDTSCGLQMAALAENSPLPPCSAFFVCSPHALDDPRRILLHNEQPGCLNHLHATPRQLAAHHALYGRGGCVVHGAKTPHALPPFDALY